MQAALPLEQYDTTGQMVLEVSVAGRDAFWRTPIGEPQCKPVGFWNKALPSSIDNCFLYYKQFLAYYWALVDTECLTMGHLNCPS